MADSTTPISTGQGQGGAQVLGSVTPLVDRADRYEARRRQVKAQEEVGKQRALKAKDDKIKSIKYKVDGIKSDGLWVDRDGKEFLKRKDAVLEKYKGKWEEMMSNPDMQLDYDKDLHELSLFSQKSKADKEYFDVTGKALLANKDKYSDKAAQKMYDFSHTPGANYEDYQIFSKPNIDLNTWTKKFITDEASNLKETVFNSWANLEKNRKGSRTRTSVDSEVAEEFIRSVISQDKSMQNHIKETYEDVGGIDAYVKEQASVLAKMYNTERNESGVISGAGAGKQDDIIKQWVDGSINLGKGLKGLVDGGGVIKWKGDNLKGKIIQGSTVVDDTALSSSMMNIKNGERITETGTFPVTYVQRLKTGKVGDHIIGRYTNDQGEIVEFAQPFVELSNNPKIVKEFSASESDNQNTNDFDPNKY